MNRAGATRSQVRPPAVAGRFYPDDPSALRSLLEQYLRAASSPEPSGKLPKAAIAPHAGYPYSGPIAAFAYAHLKPIAKRTRRIVLIGPAHYVAFPGMAVSSATAFACPLGELPVDQQATERLLELPTVHIHDAAHEPEHGLEVHLPWILHCLSDADSPPAIVPILCGQTEASHVAQAMLSLWGGDETAIIVSSDLSHYLEYDEAKELDIATSAAIESLEPHRIGPDQACGRLAIQGLLLLAAQHSLTARTLDQRSSGDTAGPRQQVVGYGAYLFA